MAQQPLASQGLIIEASRTHSDTQHSVRLLRTRYKPHANTSTWQRKHSQETDTDVPGGIRTRNPSKRVAADPRLRPLGHLYQRYAVTVTKCGPTVPMRSFALHQSTSLPCVSYSDRKYVTPSRRGTNAAANRHATYSQLMAARHNKTIRKSKVIIKINDKTISLRYVHNDEFSLCY